MKNPLKLLKREASAAEIEAAESQAAAALAAARSEVERLQKDRPTVLLDGSDRDAEELDKKIAVAGREVERIELTIKELECRRVAAAAREEEEAHVRKLAADRQAAARGSELVEAYARHAGAIAEILGEFLKVRQQIWSGNGDRAVAGYPERVAMMPAIEFLPSCVELPTVETQYQQIWSRGQRGLNISSEQMRALQRPVKPLANGVREGASAGNARTGVA